MSPQGNYENPDDSQGAGTNRETEPSWWLERPLVGVNEREEAFRTRLIRA